LIYLYYYFSFNHIKGSNGGRISKPDAVACGTIYMVVGTGNANESGGPSSSQILSSTSVAVVAANNVVPATVAIGNGGGGIRVPSAEAVGLVVPGKAGNPVEGKGEKKGFKNEEAKNGDEKVNGENGIRFEPNAGDQNGLKNGLTNCV
jgi:hypothetical protein